MLRAVPIRRAPDGEEGLLHRFFGKVRLSEDPTSQRHSYRRISLEEAGEGLRVSPDDALQEFVIAVLAGVGS